MKNKKIWFAIGGGLLAVAVVACAVVFYVRQSRLKPYNYKLDEYVKVGEYKGLSYPSQKAELQDGELDQAIQSKLQQAATTETITEGLVEDGDIINIAFTGKIDGQEFAGGSSESYDVTVGKTQMIDGFVEGLKGKPIGSSVTLDLQFPEDYAMSDLAGKPVQFDVTIHSKKVVTVPELNEDFVKKNSDKTTVEDYKKEVEDELLKDRQTSYDQVSKKELWNQIIENSEAIDYPAEELQQAQNRAGMMQVKERQQVTQQGQNWDDYLQQYYHTDQTGYEGLLDQYAKDSVFYDMIMYSISRKEKVKFSDREYKAKLADILKKNNLTAQTFQSTYGKTIEAYADENQWRNAFFLDKILDKVMKYGKPISPEEYDKIRSERNSSQAQGTETAPEEAGTEASQGE